jgi:hypothetical protein
MHDSPMPLQRDPLSVGYDDFSARFLAVCSDDLFGWHSARVTSPPGDPVDARGLSAHERAMLRSVYYTLNSTGAEGPLGGRWAKNPSRSLQIGGWSDPEYSGGILRRLLRTGPRRRVLYARLVSGFSASEAVAAYPWMQAYTVNPAEQSQALRL